MKPILLSINLIVFGLLSISNSQNSEEYIELKCMVQMTNYQGEGAYVIISHLNEAKRYQQTLSICGDDPEWYHEIESWWNYFGREEREVDAITGATLSGGQRRVITLRIPSDQIKEGDILRFETAVENQSYHPSELDLNLADAQQGLKAEGKEYIRYVRLAQN